MAVLTNLIADPSMESTSLFWDTWGSPSSFATTASEAWVGTKSRRVVAGDGHGIAPLAANAPLVSANTAYIVSFYFKGTGTVQCFLHETDLANSNDQFNLGASVAATGSWQRYVQAFTTFPVTTQKARVAIRGNGSSIDVYIDGVMLHLGAAAVPYFDGSTTDGGGYTYDWTGTTDDSTSTRTDVVATPTRLRRQFQMRPY